MRFTLAILLAVVPSAAASRSSVNAAASSMSVTFEASPPSPAPVGTLVTWVADAGNMDESVLSYRFRARRSGEVFRIVRDFGPSSRLQWTAADHEGAYEIEVSVRNNDTGEIVIVTSPYDFTSRVTDGPVLSPTANPLVWLYSAPPCAASQHMFVAFGSPDDNVQQTTSSKSCKTGLSMNFYLAGMKPRTEYVAKHTIEGGSDTTEGVSDSIEGPEIRLSTGNVSLSFPSFQLALAAGPSAAPGQDDESDVQAPDGLLLYSPLNGNAFATDLNGNIVWFYPEYLSKLTRTAPGGLFLGTIEEPTDHYQQVVREFDMAGITRRETNAGRVNEQLQAMGTRTITGFHHEARALPDGKLMVLAGVEQILNDVQGRGPVDIVGDMIIVLDRDLQVVWTWDAFDHLDVRRAATLGEMCLASGTGGCLPVFLAEKANDWLHGNSLQLTPDGNLLYSARHQDWIIKIDYNNGSGTGNVLWRLGRDGDFQADSSDPNVWFSHQHDPEVETGEPSALVVFDNGNTRRASDSRANSRGQAILLDETNRTAKFVLNADLGAYSAALGTAQKLSTGNYHFDLGTVSGTSSQAVEVSASGQLVLSFISNAQAYRIFRLRDMYTLY